MRDPSDESRSLDAAPPPPRNQEEQRREFLKLAVLGVGSSLALSQLGCGPNETVTDQTSELGNEEPSTAPNDVISSGVLISRGVAGTMTSETDRSIYRFDVSATYALTGDEISIETLSITGKPVFGQGRGDLAISKITDLRGGLDASRCFRITGAVGLTGSLSAKVMLDGCVVSEVVPSLRGILHAPGTQSLKITLA